MALVPVAEALERLLADTQPLPSENIALADAFDRVLAKPVVALRTQPPFTASAMDGYAVRMTDLATLPVRLKVIGTAAAGHVFPRVVKAGEAARIFTGAPLPDGADTVVIQENTHKLDGNEVEVFDTKTGSRNIRHVGLDFCEGDVVIEQGRRLGARVLSLAASANHPRLDVVKQPLVAIIATGDELLPPGSQPDRGQIISSNAYGVIAAARSVGARALDLGIAPDRKETITSLVERAIESGANVIVTLGGASVGEMDLIQNILADQGMKLDFWKIAMRPGKPMMFGRLGDIRCIGLPGNPVASLVCTQIFLKPLLARLGGRQFRQDIREARLETAISANNLRQDYIRAKLHDKAGTLMATPFPIQDSSMLRAMADCDGLIIREPYAAAAAPGSSCRVLMLD